ncbi:MAG: DoxX family protein [Cytophagales bacterium]|nr:DoxX family protein [Cytophagales bacterium]
MKTNKIIYWIATGLVGLGQTFAAFNYFTNPQIADAFKHLGFPDYFRIELGTAKVIGVLVLLLPFIPVRVKEWAYAGFGIVFISATIAHIASGDPVGQAIAPLVMLTFLIVSNIYLHKTKA